MDNMETITTSPSDSRLYMHTEKEMEDIIEGLILFDICHEIKEKTDVDTYERTFVAAREGAIFYELLEKLAGDDAAKMVEKIRTKFEAAKDMDPLDLFGGLN